MERGGEREREANVGLKEIEASVSFERDLIRVRRMLACIARHIQMRFAQTIQDLQ